MCENNCLRVARSSDRPPDGSTPDRPQHRDAPKQRRRTPIAVCLLPHLALALLLAGCGGGGGSDGHGGPRITSHADGETLADSAPEIVWDAGGLDVEVWQVLLGTSPGGADLFESAELRSVSSLQMCRVPTDGRSLFLQLRYRVRGGDWRSVSRRLVASPARPVLTVSTAVTQAVPFAPLELDANRCLDDAEIRVRFRYTDGSTLYAPVSTGDNPRRAHAMVPFGEIETDVQVSPSSVSATLVVEDADGVQLARPLQLTIHLLPQSTLGAGDVTLAYLAALQDYTQSVDARLYRLQRLTSAQGGHALRVQAHQTLRMLEDLRAAVVEVQRYGTQYWIDPQAVLNLESLGILDRLLLATLHADPGERAGRSVSALSDDDLVAAFRNRLDGLTSGLRDGLRTGAGYVSIASGALAVGALAVGASATPALAAGAVAGFVVLAVGTSVSGIIDGFQDSVFDGRATYETFRPTAMFFASRMRSTVTNALVQRFVFGGPLDDVGKAVLAVANGVAGNAGVFDGVVRRAFELGELAVDGLGEPPVSLRVSEDSAGGQFAFRVEASGEPGTTIEYEVIGPEGYAQRGTTALSGAATLRLPAPACSGTFQVNVAVAGHGAATATFATFYAGGGSPCSENTPPTAIIEPDIPPDEDDRGPYYLPNTLVVYDATSSSDAEDVREDLRFHWEGRLLHAHGGTTTFGGSFEEDYPDFTVNHLSKGRFTMDLAVMDSEGLIDNTVFEVEIRDLGEGLYVESEVPFVAWSIRGNDYRVTDPDRFQIITRTEGGVRGGDLLVSGVNACPNGFQACQIGFALRFPDAVAPGSYPIDDPAASFIDLLLTGASASASYANPAFPDTASWARSDFQVARTGGAPAGSVTVGNYEVSPPVSIERDAVYPGRSLETRHLKVRGSFAFEGSTWPPQPSGVANEVSSVNGEFLFVSSCTVERGAVLAPSTCPGF